MLIAMGLGFVVVAAIAIVRDNLGFAVAALVCAVIFGLVAGQ